MSATVREMLQWKLPPVFIMLVLILKLSDPQGDPTLDFIELFAGCAQVSEQFRKAPCSTMKDVFVCGITMYCLWEHAV